MTNETRLMIQNQMITNNLLKLLVASNVSDFIDNRIQVANELDEAADDMVKSRQAFEKLI